MESKKTTDTELVTAVKHLLKSSGHLNKLQAQMRAQVTEALKLRQDCLNSDKPNTITAPAQNKNVQLINELVREYLEWNGYLYTASVMDSEVGMPEEKKNRLELCAAVGVTDDEKSSNLPLLSNIIATYIERIKRKINKGAKNA